MKVVLISFLLFGLALANLNCECGKRNAGRIVGGKETKKNEYPWMVALQKVYSSNTYCGGTILTTWHVITAAHCVLKLEASDLVLYAGAYDVNDFRDSSRQELSVEQIVRHPNYETVFNEADIALLVTSTEIVFNQNVGPACMPTKLLGNELNGQSAKVMGWGRYNPNEPNQDAVRRLREVDLQVQSVNACKGFGGKKICTFAPNKSPCSGDSGGPLVWLDPETNRYTLIGVVSTATNTCGISTDRPSTHANISFYRAWINMRIQTTKSTAQTCHKV